MYSSEGEYVKFTSEVNTNLANGNVDNWLQWVEERMIESIHHVTQKALEEYKIMSRSEWVIGRCGMAVLCINMTYWTSECEETIINYGSKGIADFHG